MKDFSCPTCQADVLLDGGEQPGDEVFCTYCGAPLKIKGGRRKSEDEDIELEEDF